MFTSAILLAAGSATRMGAEKLLLPYKGQRIIDRALAPFVNSGLIDEVVVVVRSGFLFPVNEPKCRVVVNADHQEGLGASLRLGAAAANTSANAYVVSLADLPELTIAIIATLIEAFCAAGKQILVPIYDQRHGHPVIFDQSCRKNLLRLGGDVGAIQMIRNHPEMVKYFPTPDHAVVFDIDAPEDLELKHRSFDDYGAFRQATARLESAGVYFETVDAADATRGAPAAIASYPFDEDRVAALCGRTSVSVPCGDRKS